MSRQQRAIDVGEAASELGSFLRKLRGGRNEPQWRVAAAAEMDSASLSKIELGDRLPTPEQAGLLARFFGVPLREIERRRIAAKFWLEHGNNPAVAAAAEAIHDTATAYVVNKPVNKPGKVSR